LGVSGFAMGGTGGALAIAAKGDGLELLTGSAGLADLVATTGAAFGFNGASLVTALAAVTGLVADCSAFVGGALAPGDGGVVLETTVPAGSFGVVADCGSAGDTAGLAGPGNVRNRLSGGSSCRNTGGTGLAGASTRSGAPSESDGPAAAAI